MSSYVTKHGETIPSNMRSLISTRYQTVTRAVNVEFWNSSSNSAHSLYVGSYGRGTAIDTSDIDILVEVPESNYRRYDTLKGNGQSRLLQKYYTIFPSKYYATIQAPGSNQTIDASNSVECLEKVLRFMAK